MGVTIEELFSSGSVKEKEVISSLKFKDEGNVYFIKIEKLKKEIS